jgi:methylenetetrahydrofolate dehydrogenase (NADP+)/methenyltetrahydrofolate cyclohydrolase
MIIDGKAIAREIENEIISEIHKLNPTPSLKMACVIVGADEGTKSYMRSIQRVGKKIGIEVDIKDMPETSSTDSIVDSISKLNPEVDGIMVGRPFPSHVDDEAVVASISPEKDVDCLHPTSLGRLFLGTPLFTPCTPQAIIEILNRTNTGIRGKRVTIIGRSNIVGKPLAIMLIQRGVDATVTVCHTKTVELESRAREADILVVAAGRAGLVGANMIKQGAVVIDVGTNFENGKLAGDVNFEEAEPVSSLITPVPGGVGPITTRILMQHVLLSRQRALKA